MNALDVSVDTPHKVNDDVSAFLRSRDVPQSIFHMCFDEETAKGVCEPPPGLLPSVATGVEFAQVVCGAPPGLTKAAPWDRLGTPLGAYGWPMQQSQVSSSSSTDAGSSGGDRDSETDSVTPLSYDPEHYAMVSGRTPLRLGASTFVPQDSYELLQQVSVAPLAEATVTDDKVKTSVMLSIPSIFNEARVCQMLDVAGLAGRYDSVRVPMHVPNGTRKGRPASKGYAFVNFITHEDAICCYFHFHGKVLSENGRECYVRWATSQRQHGNLSGASELRV